MSSKNNRCFLGAVIIVKNESKYIKEWLEFHKLVGFERFFVYDNESTDSTKQILEPYIKSGIVEYIYWPGQKQQLLAYNHALKSHKTKCNWLAFIDADEFVVPAQVADIPSMIREIARRPGVAQIICPWIMYGPNGHITEPDGLVIKNYTTHRPLQHYGLKSILNPRKIAKMVSPHQGIPHIFCYSIDTDGKKYKYDWFGHQWESDKILPYDRIRINHYYTKSVARYKERNKIASVLTGLHPRTKELLEQICADSTIYDDVMTKYIEKLAQNFNKKGELL